MKIVKDSKLQNRGEIPREPYKKRKLYKFELFRKSNICFEAEEFKFDEISNSFSKINLEIGAGTAELSLGLAQKYPNQLFIATDVKADRLVQGAIKAKNLELDNVLFVRSNTRNLLSLINPKSISSLWITFPDPMPKDRQEKHRLVNSQFLRIYKDLLGQGGQVLFKTDDRNLFNYGLEQAINGGGQIDALSFDLHVSDLKDEYKITTVYERKFIKAGKPINFVKFRL
jgi:tRNA (guanine-N7-)-methyltransferase